MKKFKEFLYESIETQLARVRRETQNVLNRVPATFGKSDQNFVYNRTSPEASIRLEFERPKEGGPAGTHFYARKDNKNYGSIIDVFTDTPGEVRDPLSPERSTLHHEMAHREQALRRLEDNPQNQELVRSSQARTFSALKPRAGLPGSSDVIDQIRSDANYWVGNRQEINARGVERGLLAQDVQNQSARARVAMNPEIQNFEFELERSKGTAPAPELKSVDARARSAGVDAMKQVLRPENVIYGKQLVNTLFLGNPSDVRKLATAAEKSYKSVASDVGRAVMANEPHAAEVMRDAYSDKVTGPQRERATRVANTQADVETTKSARMAAGLGSGAFSSDPISISNLGMDVAGAMGDSSLRGDQVRKAAASLYNPMYSDSEQMMGDALLRGGGEDFQVDPTFLRVAQQREKDRKK